MKSSNFLRLILGWVLSAITATTSLFAMGPALPVVRLSVNPAVLNFGTGNFPNEARTLAVELQNTGNVNLSSLNLGADNIHFPFQLVANSNCLNNILVPGEKCLITYGVQSFANTQDLVQDLALSYTASGKLYPFNVKLIKEAAYTRIFVTSAKYSGNLGGFVGADAKCQKSAQSAGLSGNWVALLGSSTGTNGIVDYHYPLRETVVTKGHLYNLRGEQVTNILPNSSAFYRDGAPRFINAVKYTETGESIPDSDSSVWTGQWEFGSDYATSTCNNWTSDVSQYVSNYVPPYYRYTLDGGLVGSAVDARSTLGIRMDPYSTSPDVYFPGGGFYIAGKASPCEASNHLYCVEQVPAAPSDLGMTATLIPGQLAIKITVTNYGKGILRQPLEVKVSSDRPLHADGLVTLAPLAPLPGTSQTYTIYPYVYTGNINLPGAILNATIVLDPNLLIKDPNRNNNLVKLSIRR